MKRLIAILLLFFVLLAACKKEEEDKDFPREEEEQKGQTVLDISSMTLALDNDGNAKTFSIVSNGEWTITNNSSWCKTNKTYGKGNTVVNVMASPYDEYDDRNTNLTIKAGNKTKVITITQKKKDALLLTEEKYVVGQAGDTITVEVKSNLNYSVTIPSAHKGWIKEVSTPTTKALVTGKKHFEISPNTKETKREGIIVFKDNDSSLADTVHVYQSEYKELVIVQKDYTLTGLATTLSVELRTNIDYDVIIPTDAQEWITHLDTRSIRTDYVSLSIAKNETQYDREAEIIIKDKNGTLSDTLHIRQMQKRTLGLRKKLIYVEAKGGEVAVELLTDVDYEVSIPHSASGWISMVSTKAIRTEELIFSVAAHESSDSRRVEIIIKDRNSALTDTLVIEQATIGAYIGDIVLETAQDWIDFYEADYTSVYGDILIKNYYYNPNNQQANNQLISIHGSLIVNGELAWIDNGFSGLQEITGNLIFKQGYGETFNELQNLRNIGGDFELNADTYFSSFEGLVNLESIGGNFKICTSCNDSLPFRKLNSLKRIDGDFEIKPGYSTYFALSSFEGLENLEIIGGSFKLSATTLSLSNLTSFHGLSGLKRINGDFKIHGSNSWSFGALSSFEGLENLESIGGNFRLSSSSAESLDVLTSFRGLNGLKRIDGNFEIETSISSILYYSSPLEALSSFEGLENLENIGGHFTIKVSTSNASSPLKDLNSFHGLSSLKNIGGNFSVIVEYYSSGIGTSSLDALSSFEGLENLENIGGDFCISASSICYSSEYHFARTLKSLTSFRGLSKLKRIGGKLTVSAYSSSGSNSSSLEAFTSLDGLENLESVGRLSIHDCPSLTDFCALKKAIKNIDSGNYSIYKNAYNPTQEQILNGKCSR